MRAYARFVYEKGTGWRDNKRFIILLRLIAEHKGYINSGNICYRKLYKEVLKPALINEAMNNGVWEEAFQQIRFNGQHTWFSYRQFKTLLQSKSKLPLLTSIYLKVVFDLICIELNSIDKQIISIYKQPYMTYSNFSLEHFNRLYDYFENHEEESEIDPLDALLYEVWNTFQPLDQYCANHGWDTITN